MSKKIGDIESFEKSWQGRTEAYYNHWTRGATKNQVQFAFRNHWIVFKELMNNRNFNNGKRCLEVGCGRGSISSYFSYAGYECTLLDVSEEAINIAKEIFRRNQLTAKFKIGNAINIPFNDESFDIIVSIGLLEHFEDIKHLIKEQTRVLDKGGLFLGYVVPRYRDNVQNDYIWINNILKGYLYESKKKVQPQKEKLYRTDYNSIKYIKIMEKNGLYDIHASGIYPLPMISHSIEFPFTLMPEKSEKVLLSYFKKCLEERKKNSDMNPWLCEEGYGQAFLIWGYKK